MTRFWSILAGVVIASLCVGSVLHAQPVNITKQSGSQSEGDIGIDPTNPLRMFACANNNTASVGMTCARSTDGGVTWTVRAIANGTDGLPMACCDPTIAWDNFGNLFLGYLDDAISAAVLVRSSDGGATFTLVRTWPAQDQPKVAIGANHVWMTWNNGSMQAAGAPVTGPGAVGTFSATQTIPSSNNGNFGGIAVGPTGQVMVSFQNAASGVGPDTVRVSVDPDGVGPLPFGAPVVASSTNVGGFSPVPPQNVRTIDAEGKVNYDRSGGSFNGRAYLVYTDKSAPNSPDSNIFVRTSTDNGATWSAPVKVNDDTGTTSQFNPKLAVDQTTGNVAVMFYDARNSATNTTVQVYAAVSTDGGATFQPNVQVTSGFSNCYSAAGPDFPGLGPAGFLNSGNQFADYSGIAFHAGAFYPIWADNSNSTGDNPNGANQGLNMYTRRMTVGPPPGAGVTIAQSGGSTTVAEGGATDTYTVVLNSAPSANVTITINPGTQLTATPTPLTFTPANWNVPQTVTVAAVDDTAVEGAHTGTIAHTATSTDTAYNGVTIANVTANITDNDGATAGVTITHSGGSTNVTEGGATDSYTVVLNTAPTANVTITVVGGTQVTVLPTTLVFTPANFNVAQTVTVTAVDDAAVEGPHTATITHTSASTDTTYNGLTIASVTVNIVDNDSPGVTIVQSGGATAVTEGGATDTYTVVLNTAPTANVTITINGGGQVTVAPTTLTFTTANWSTAQTVTVTAVNDVISEGPHVGVITHTATSTDTAYNGIVIASVIANITDDEPPPPPQPPPAAGNEGNYPGSFGLGGNGEGTFGFGRMAAASPPILDGPRQHPVDGQRVLNVSGRRTMVDDRSKDTSAGQVVGLTLFAGLILAAARGFFRHMARG